MTKTLREMLDEIDAMLLEPLIGNELWDVLTAMGGPDSGIENEQLKRKFTAPLRTMAFPRFAAVSSTNVETGCKYNRYGQRVGGDLQEVEVEDNYYSRHFIDHVYRASWALRNAQKESEDDKDTT